MSRRPEGRPRVVLVGRPNVGKSTLFNRICGTRRAIVTATPGTTRDVIEHNAEWRGVPLLLVDTGGMFGASADTLHTQVFEHGRRAVAAADLVLFLVDAREGLVPGDQEIALELRKAGRPVLLVINKVDSAKAGSRALDFYRLGFEHLFEISAEHGLGTGELLDTVIERLPPTSSFEAEGEEVRVSVIGRPNVGKSSLVNRFLREERVMVDPLPGTTRDVVDAVLTWHRRQFRIVDTAGIRRAGRVAAAGRLESVSVVMARRSIEQADVAVVVIDASQGVSDQDAAVAGEAHRAGRGIVIAANKWDLLTPRTAETAAKFDEDLRFRLKFLEYAPIVHVSAATGERVERLLETIDRVAAARRRRVPTGELNRFLEAVSAVHPPASPGKREVRILYAAQTGTAPPTFVVFTNVATKFHFSYERFLSNRLREAFGFEGTPIVIRVRRRSG